jgi:uncharacterized protein (TIGR02001 family)
MNKCAALVIAALAVTAGSAFAEEKAIQVDTEIGVLSHYVWRGMVLDERATAQGNVTFSHESGFFADVWFNTALSESSDITGEAELNEVDYTFGYASTFKNIDYSAGAIVYAFPNDSDLDSTYELFVTAAVNDLIVTPYFELYTDINEANGVYAKLGVEDDIEISDAVTVTFGASMGYGSDQFNEYYFGDEDSALLDGSIYAKGSYALSEQAALSCMISFSKLVDGGVGDIADGLYESDKAVVAGVSYSYSF